MTTSNAEKSLLHRLQSTAVMFTLAILLCGCAPLKVNQGLGSKPLTGKPIFGKLFNKKPSSDANDEESNSNVLTSAQAAENSQLEKLRQTVDKVTPGQRQSDATQTSVPTAQFTDKETMAHLLEVETKSAYEQGRYDAMQAAYQQPSDRNYTNPQHFQPGYPSQYSPQHLFHRNFGPQTQTYPGDAYPGPQGTQPQGLDLHGPGANASNSNNTYLNDPYLNDPYSNDPYSNDAYAPRPSHLDSQAAPNSHSQTIQEPPSPNSTQGRPSQQRSAEPSKRAHSTRNATGNETARQMEYAQQSRNIQHGVKFYGSELRSHDQTATEIAIELEDKNAELLAQIKVKELEILQMEEKASQQKQVLERTDALLKKSNRLAALLREKIAKQNLAIQDLEKEKMAIELSADRALKDIESNLDGMLMNSISSKQSK